MTDKLDFLTPHNALPLLISRNLVVFPHSKNIIEVGRECSLASIKCSLSAYQGEIIVIAREITM